LNGKNFKQYAKRFGVKQWVCEIQGDWAKFRVFTTGDAKYYLFAILDTKGIDIGLHIPVRKTDLSPWARKYISQQFAK